LSDANYSEPLTIRETKEISAIIERVAKKEGIPAGVLVRNVFRKYLRALSDLTDQEKKVLGLNGQTK
jgi:hypothetical protein